jgi:hypothetical protein
VRSPTCWCSSYLPYTSQAECPRLRTGMGQDSVQHRIGRSFDKGGSAHRAASKRPRVGRRSVVRRRRARIVAGRRRRRPLFFYAVVASVVGELVAIALDMEALVLLFSLTGLLLCAVVFQAAKT